MLFYRAFMGQEMRGDYLVLVLDVQTRRNEVTEATETGQMTRNTGEGVTHPYR